MHHNGVQGNIDTLVCPQYNNTCFTHSPFLISMKTYYMIQTQFIFADINIELFSQQICFMASFGFKPRFVTIVLLCHPQMQGIDTDFNAMNFSHGPLFLVGFGISGMIPRVTKEL